MPVLAAEIVKPFSQMVTNVTIKEFITDLRRSVLVSEGLMKCIACSYTAEHFFCFDVPNVGETELVAVAGNFEDKSRIRKVEKFNEEYRLREKGAVLNWFDITEPDGYFSLNSKLSDIMASEAGRQLFMGLMTSAMQAQGDDTMMGNMGAEMMSGPMMQMMGGFTVLRLASLMGAANLKFTKEQLLGLNAALNQIKKPE